MKAPPLDYLRPADLAEALETLHRLGDEARILGGGQSLVPMLNMRLVQPGTLIDISGLGELKFIRRDNTHVDIGGAVTQQGLLTWPDLAEALPLVAKALPHVGHFQTRNRGTFAGSIAHADPSSEQPLLAAVLEAEVQLRSTAGHRVIKAADFFVGPLTTAKAANEIVTGIRLPLRRPGQGFAFAEVARRTGDFAIVAIAAVADADTIRIGIGGVADRPVVEQWTVTGAGPLNEALNALAWRLGGSDDLHASARYRRELVRRLGRQTIEEALQCRS